MFGYNIQLIAEGWAKDALKLEQDLHDKRIKICLLCPLYTADSWLGKICDAKKFYDTKSDLLLTYPTDNTIQGCGCALDKKTRLVDAHCVLDKW